MIGLSLSLCIRDIIESDDLAPEQVEKIVAGTCITTPEELDKVIADYRRSYWQDDPDEGERICRWFFEQGRVEQPCIRGEAAHSISQGHWR